MKKLIISFGIAALGSFLAGCSSVTYISTKPYEDQLMQSCLEKIPPEMAADPEKKRACVFEVNRKSHFAMRLFDATSDDMLKTCESQNKDKEAVNSCFVKAQENFYTNLWKLGKQK